MRFLVTITAALHILITTPLCALGALVAVVCFVMPKGWCWMKRHPVKVVFGEPIDTGECTPDTKDELMTRVRERIELVRQEAIDWQEGA